MPMKRIFCITMALAGFLTIGTSQTKESKDLLEDIRFYSDVMVNAEAEEHRLKAYDLFEESMSDFLSLPDSYSASLDSIRWFSVLKGVDFRIVTWQLKISRSEHKYGGIIQWADRLVVLKDTRPWVNGSQRNIYSPSAWYGALYYKMIPFEKDRKTYYLLFGFNAEDESENTKVADVLDVTSPEPKFGLPVFVGKDEPQSRLILRYSDISPLQLFFDESQKAVIHDHLLSLEGAGPEGTSLMVSDGSQEGWLYKNGLFQYQEEMYDVQVTEPPFTDERRDRKEDKDILGRPKKE